MATDFDQDTRVALDKALQVLEAFRAVDPEMTMGAAVSLLLIASEGDLSVTEVSKRGGFALSSASRYVQYLGEMDRHRRPGKELVKDCIDPMERRKKVINITNKGKCVVALIRRALG